MASNDVQAKVRGAFSSEGGRAVTFEPPGAPFAGCYVLLYDETNEEGGPGGTFTLSLYIDNSAGAVSVRVNLPGNIIDVPPGFKQADLQALLDAYRLGGGGPAGGGPPGTISQRP